MGTREHRLSSVECIRTQSPAEYSRPSPGVFGFSGPLPRQWACFLFKVHVAAQCVGHGTGQKS